MRLKEIASMPVRLQPIQDNTMTPIRRISISKIETYRKNTFSKSGKILRGVACVYGILLAAIIVWNFKIPRKSGGSISILEPSNRSTNNFSFIFCEAYISIISSERISRRSNNMAITTTIPAGMIKITAIVGPIADISLPNFQPGKQLFSIENFPGKSSSSIRDIPYVSAQGLSQELRQWQHSYIPASSLYHMVSSRRNIIRGQALYASTKNDDVVEKGYDEQQNERDEGLKNEEYLASKISTAHDDEDEHNETNANMNAMSLSAPLPYQGGNLDDNTNAAAKATTLQPFPLPNETVEPKDKKSMSQQLEEQNQKIQILMTAMKEQQLVQQQQSILQQSIPPLQSPPSPLSFPNDTIDLQQQQQLQQSLEPPPSRNTPFRQRQQQPPPPSTVSPTPPLQSIFLDSARQHPQQQPASMFSSGQQQKHPQIAPLKAMLFIDGTWLYYSMYQRDQRRCPILKQFGPGWHNYYNVDWSALPRLIAEQLQIQNSEQNWSSQSDSSNLNHSLDRSIEIVRASVYTSYKRGTDKQSNRVKMFQQMQEVKYDVHQMETVGKSEKCIDIQLAVEMLHYATVPGAYDVAILLSGDKDFIPALVRTRQKGKQVAIVSMKSGCNRALYESPHVRDYNVVWIDDVLPKLIKSKPVNEINDLSKPGMISPVTMRRIIFDFIMSQTFVASESSSGCSETVRSDDRTTTSNNIGYNGDGICSRDIGRYLKHVNIEDGHGGTSNMLYYMKDIYGGLRFFLLQYCKDIFGTWEPESDNRDPGDRSFFVEILSEHADDMLRAEAKRTKFSDEEKKFLETYNGPPEDVILQQQKQHHVLATTTGIDDNGDDSDDKYSTSDEKLIMLENEDEDAHNNGFQPHHQKQLYQKQDLIIPSNLMIQDYSKFKATELKELCRGRKLRLSGTKAVLIERLTDDNVLKIRLLNAAHKNQEQLDDQSRTKSCSVKMQRSRTLGPRLSKRKRAARNGFGGNGGVNTNHSLQQKDATKSNNDFTRDLYSLMPTSNTYNPNNIGNNNDNYNSNGSNNKQGSHQKDSRYPPIHPVALQYLEKVICDFLSNHEGQAGSRDIGRHLASMPPSSVAKPQHQTSLNELKEHYYSLAIFFNKVQEQQQRNKFQKLDENPEVYGITYGFPVRLLRR